LFPRRERYSAGSRGKRSSRKPGEKIKQEARGKDQAGSQEKRSSRKPGEKI
jgi:hypothetical protein